MRGRLIFRFSAELHRLDARATRYDHDFKEPLRVDLEGDGIGERLRSEHPAIRIPCQVEPQLFEFLSMKASGGDLRSDLDLVFHFRDLERLGLVDVASGEALIRPSDRLGAIYDRAGALVQAIRTPPGLYVKEARPIGFGLGRARPRRNLLLVSFHSRSQAPRRTS